MQVSTDGGSYARWRGNGREIIYSTTDGRRLAVPITPDADGSRVRPGSPVVLFTVQLASAVTQDNFQAMPDGQRFLANVPVGTPPPVPITIVLNWQPSPGSRELR